MDLRADLSASTRPAHEALERLMQLDSAPSAARYGWYLLTMHAVVAAAENAMAGDRRLDSLGLSLGERRKLAWLEADLRNLGLERPAGHFAPAIPADVASRVGWAYVLEGSTLGGRVMLKHMAPRLGLAAQHGARFLAGYGERTGEMWRGFVDALDAIPFEPAERKACAAGAAQAFTSIAETFRAISVAGADLGVHGQAGRGLAA